ncbi:MAG: slipin family protein [Candidatus Peregrinibacteria bacterium]|nr:slipin family protein [Candidatus Peregrinibacteria bacterium]
MLEFIAQYPYIIVIVALILSGFFTVSQYEKGVIFRFGKVVGVKEPGLNWMIPLIDRVRKVDMRTITMPIPKQKIITKDNVSVDISAVAYYKIVDPIKSIVAIERVMDAINQIAQTSMRNIVGRFQLDEILSERETINKEITTVLDTHTESWGVIISVVEIKDIELPESMQRAMAKQAEAEREKRAKIIAAEGEFLSSQKLAETADIMMEHPIALQLRNLQTMAEIAVEKNSTIIFPSQFMGTIQDVKRFMEAEGAKK